MMYFLLLMMIGILLSVIYGILNIYFIGFLEDSYMIFVILLILLVFVILMGLGNLFGVGVGIYILCLLGVKDYSKSKFVSSFFIYGGIVLGFIVILVVLLFSD